MGGAKDAALLFEVSFCVALTPEGPIKAATSGRGRAEPNRTLPGVKLISSHMLRGLEDARMLVSPPGTLMPQRRLLT